MADLCNEHLDSDILTDSLTHPIMLFASTAYACDHDQALKVKIPSEKVIGCL